MSAAVPMVRPVRCHLCGEPMHYAGRPGHEPEARVVVQIADDEYVLYVHLRCWDARMAPAWSAT